MSDDIYADIKELVARYCAENHTQPAFVPGKTPVLVSGRVFDADDVHTLVLSSLEFWLTTGKWAAFFSEALARFFGLRSCVLTNSGSSANLLAVSALTSPSLVGQRLVPGDEVITVAAGFPTTVNPLIQNGLVPVFVDIALPFYNIDVSQLQAALSKRTRAFMLAHTLGNPFDLSAVMEFARVHKLLVVEDCCDALGSTYEDRPVGTFGVSATLSFYPAHHITTGEGGAVVTWNPKMATIMESFRDWGRDCWCDPGKDNTCGKRYDWKLGALPYGYDHKYIYSHIGYNLKMTDMQAAVGYSQMSKLPGFIAARKNNFATLYAGLKDIEHFITPVATPGSDPSWFGFPLTIRKGAPFSRRELLVHLESKKIGTRLLFGGNLMRQPAYKQATWRAPVPLTWTDHVAENGFWLGVYPGLTPEMLQYVIDTIRSFCGKH